MSSEVEKRSGSECRIEMSLIKLVVVDYIYYAVVNPDVLFYAPF